MMSPRIVAWLLVLGLVASACGTRLSEEQVAAYSVRRDPGAPAVAQGSAGATEPGADGAGTAGTATAAPGSSGGGGGDGPGAGPTPAPSAQPGTAAAPDGQSGDGGDATAGNAPAAQQQDGGTDPGRAADGTRDTRAAPPGGNGGATDVGVTEDRIVIYNVADLSGAVPGLFRDAYEATLAYVQYFTATEGTVYGRRLELVSRDSQLSTNGNRAAYLDACESAFAAVGSMSAFEEGAADPITDCGLPDLRTVNTSEALQRVETVFGTLAQSVGQISIGEWTWYKQQFPEGIRNAGFVWLENQTTNYQVGQYLSGTERIGYRWVAEIPVAVSETNYARIVSNLEEAGAQLVAFQGAYQQAARLAQAMEQQGYRPKALVLQSNTYTPDLIETCGAPCEEFVFVAQTGSLLEEIDSNPELQRYAEWLARVNPRARPTGLGMYAWAATKLFVQRLKDVGPDLTRQRMLQSLGQVTAYDADGLVPEQDIATQQVAGCVIILDIQDGRFVRVAPASGYRCRSGPA